MIEIVADHRRLAEGRPVPVVVPEIEHALPGRVFPDLLIQPRPVFGQYGYGKCECECPKCKNHLTVTRGGIYD